MLWKTAESSNNSCAVSQSQGEGYYVNVHRGSKKKNLRTKTRRQILPETVTEAQCRATNTGKPTERQKMRVGRVRHGSAIFFFDVLCLSPKLYSEVKVWNTERNH